MDSGCEAPEKLKVEIDEFISRIIRICDEAKLSFNERNLMVNLEVRIYVLMLG